jgi:hypothetical protein
MSVLWRLTAPVAWRTVSGDRIPTYTQIWGHVKRPPKGIESCRSYDPDPGVLACPTGRSDKRGARSTATTHRKEMQRRGDRRKKGAESIWWPSRPVRRAHDTTTSFPAIPAPRARHPTELSRGAFQASTAPCLRRAQGCCLYNYICIYKRLLPLWFQIGLRHRLRVCAFLEFIRCG